MDHPRNYFYIGFSGAANPSAWHRFIRRVLIKSDSWPSEVFKRYEPGPAGFSLHLQPGYSNPSYRLRPGEWGIVSTGCSNIERRREALIKVRSILQANGFGYLEMASGEIRFYALDTGRFLTPTTTPIQTLPVRPSGAQMSQQDVAPVQAQSLDIERAQTQRSDRTPVQTQTQDPAPSQTQKSDATSAGPQCDDFRFLSTGSEDAKIARLLSRDPVERTCQRNARREILRKVVARFSSRDSSRLAMALQSLFPDR